MAKADKFISISTSVLVAFLAGGVFWLSFDALKDLTAGNCIANGMAGAGGKTRFGWQVAIYDRSGLNFLPFQQHPNAHTVFLEDPARAIVCFVLLCEMIRERFITLRQAGVSAWRRLPSADPSTPLPAPRVLVVIDGFANRSADAHGEA
ncbi:MAG: hypothetical protein HF973_08815 [Chloroflexi bacterium]|nr:hypothetical protein [Chloroflexota bacterium]